MKDLGTEEAINQTYNLLRGILSHFDKFENLHRTEVFARNTGELYPRHQSNTNDITDKKLQFLEDKKLIQEALEELNQAIALHAERLTAEIKTAP